MVHGNVASTPWGSTLAGLAQTRASCVIELRGDDGRGPFQLHIQDGELVDSMAAVPEGDAIRIASEYGILQPEHIARARGAIMAAPHRDELETIASAAVMTRDEALNLRAAVTGHRAALSFGISYGAYNPIPMAPRSHGMTVSLYPVIVHGALAFMPPSRMRNELARAGDVFELVGQPNLAPFAFPERLAPVAASLSTPHTIDSLLGQHRGIGAQEVLAVTYALYSAGAVKGGRRSVPVGTRSPIGGGVSFKRATPVAGTPVIQPPAPPPHGTPPPTEPQPTPPPPPPRTTGEFDLHAAILDELGDEPFSFEETSPPGKPGPKR